MRDVIRYSGSPQWKIVGNAMLATCTVILLTSCETATWPTDESSLRRLFEQNKDFFALIEIEMRADNIRQVSHADLDEASSDSVPTMNHLLLRLNLEKYRELVGAQPLYVYHTLGDGFCVALESMSGRDRTYEVGFRRSSSAAEADPECDSEVMDEVCGTCSHELGDQWTAIWSWAGEGTGKPKDACDKSFWSPETH